MLCSEECKHRICVFTIQRPAAWIIAHFVHIQTGIYQPNAILHNLLDFKYSYYRRKSVAVKQSSLCVYMYIQGDQKLYMCMYKSYSI